MAEPKFTIEFYQDENGREPVREWARGLESYLSRALGVALYEVLQKLGISVCASEWGKQIGGGLFEFRIRHAFNEILHMFGAVPDPPAKQTKHEDVLLRVYCHAYGDQIILLLAAYDKHKEPSKTREQEEIRTAGKRLKDFQVRMSQGTYGD